MIIGRIKIMLPKAVFASNLKVSKKDLDDVMAPSLFGMVSSFDSFGTEKEFAPCVRLNIQGTRKIILTPFYSVYAYMKEKKVHGVDGDFSIACVRDYFKAMTKELLQNYVQSGNKVYHITIGAGSMIFVPAGMLFAERSGRAVVNLGIRLGVVFPDPESLSGLKGLCKWKEASKANSTVLGALCAELTAQAPAE